MGAIVSGVGDGRKIAAVGLWTIGHGTEPVDGTVVPERSVFRAPEHPCLSVLWGRRAPGRKPPTLGAPLGSRGDRDRDRPGQAGPPRLLLRRHRRRPVA